MASRAPSSSSATPPSPSAPRTATSTASRTARCWRAWSGRGLGRDATPWLPIRSPPVNLVRWRAARDRSARRAPVLLLAIAYLLALIGRWEHSSSRALAVTSVCFPTAPRFARLALRRHNIRRRSKLPTSCGRFPYRLPVGFSGRRSHPTSSFFGTLLFSARPRNAPDRIIRALYPSRPKPDASAQGPRIVKPSTLSRQDLCYEYMCHEHI